MKFLLHNSKNFTFFNLFLPTINAMDNRQECPCYISPTTPQATNAQEAYQPKKRLSKVEYGAPSFILGLNIVLSLFLLPTPPITVSDLNYPLVVDLDGTLIKTDLMQEAIAAYVRQNPINIVRVLAWLCKGRAFLKQKLAQNAPPIDPATLPYNDDFLAYLKTQKANKRVIILATASHYLAAKTVFDYIGLFDELLATQGDVNLRSTAKADLLVQKYGEKGFDYAGNSRDDIAVWAKSAQPLLVNTPPALTKRYPDAPQFNLPAARLPILRQAVRPHQWAKNLLLFIAAVGSHQLLDAQTMANTFISFVVFCALASAIYLINDIVDINSDRLHPQKSRRPLAAGTLSIFAGVTVSLVLFFIASVLSLTLLPFDFFVVALIYVLATLAYSFYIKRRLLLDVLTLSLLFTLRVIAGGEANDIELSFWLLAFSVFIFLSLAMLKRYADLVHSHQDSGRAYNTTDSDILAAVGIAVGINAMLVLSLYINSEIVATRYNHPQFIWLIIPIMTYWIARIWILAKRGEVKSDPVLFAVGDKSSWLAGVAVLCLVYLAI